MHGQSRQFAKLNQNRLLKSTQLSQVHPFRRGTAGRAALAGSFVVILFTILGVARAGAQSVWLQSPGDGNWSTAANWNPAVAPNSDTANAEFGQSSVTSLSILASTTVAGITFDSGASAFTIGVSGGTMLIKGTGVTNNSSVTQTFGVTSALYFQNSSTAGTSSVAYNVSGSGLLFFTDSSSAGSSVITVTGSGAQLDFASSASGGSARFVNAGGDLYFENSNGANTLGSIEGTGGIHFSNANGGAAAQSLTVGSLGTDTAYSGSIGDDGAVGTLIKAGSGMLTLSGVNSYSGGTVFKAGTVSISSDSNLGAAPGSAVADHLNFDGGALQATGRFTLDGNRGITLTSSV
jgi:autotransporter-associated beta strand protein